MDITWRRKSILGIHDFTKYENIFIKKNHKNKCNGINNLFFFKIFAIHVMLLVVIIECLFFIVIIIASKLNNKKLVLNISYQKLTEIVNIKNP